LALREARALFLFLSLLLLLRLTGVVSGDAGLLCAGCLGARPQYFLDLCFATVPVRAGLPHQRVGITPLTSVPVLFLYGMAVRRLVDFPHV